MGTEMNFRSLLSTDFYLFHDILDGSARRIFSRKEGTVAYC